jgi:hypothetical protein
VNSATPAVTSQADPTPVSSIPLTGTWFARVGARPYELLGLANSTPGTRVPVRTLPRMDLAA